MTELTKDRPIKIRVPKIPLKKLKQLWETQRKTEEIAVHLGISTSHLHTLAKRHNLPKRTHLNVKRRGTADVDPTPEEIAIRAAECRARWTDADYNRSHCYKSGSVEMKSYSFDSRSFAFSVISREA
jgi:hypothetical protein